MKILLQENETSRIVQAWGLLGYRIKRQRKRGMWWKTTASLYSYIYLNLEDFVRHFDWEEKKGEDLFGKKQF